MVIAQEKDLIIGAVNNLTYEQITPWLDTLKETGYNGDVALLVYECNDMHRIIANYNVLPFKATGKFSMSGRFFEMWKAIGKHESIHNFRYRNIITTDVRDVKFQTNPGLWLWQETSNGSGLIVGTENICYADEPWSKSNMQSSFGLDVYNVVANRPIVCAGVIAGQRKYVLDMMLSLTLVCNGMPNEIPGGGGPDQAALNVLLTTNPWKAAAQIETIRSNGIVHLGTTMPAIEKGKGEIGFQYINGFLPKEKIKFVDSVQPKYIDGQWLNPSGVPYSIVHQYDRAE